MLRHLGLDEQRRLIRIDTGGQPVDDHVPGCLFDILRIVVMRRQRMPVRDKEQAGILMLELGPVLEHTMVMAEVQEPGRAHAGKNTFCVHSRFSKDQKWFR